MPSSKQRSRYCRKPEPTASHGCGQAFITPGAVGDLHVTEEAEPVDADLGSVARRDLDLAVPEGTESAAGSRQGRDLSGSYYRPRWPGLRWQTARRVVSRERLETNSNISVLAEALGSGGCQHRGNGGHHRPDTRNGDTWPAELRTSRSRLRQPPAGRHVRPLTAAADTGEALRLLVGSPEPSLRRLTASAAAGPGPAETGDRLGEVVPVQRGVHRDLSGATRRVVVLRLRCTSAGISS